MPLTDWALVASRAVLGATFLVAGLAKLTDPGTAARTVAGFGAPAFARPLLRGLPYLEATVAVTLAFAATAHAQNVIAGRAPKRKRRQECDQGVGIRPPVAKALL